MICSPTQRNSGERQQLSEGRGGQGEVAAEVAEHNNTVITGGTSESAQVSRDWPLPL